jgi:OFA family oxalate/formate antiporter-like MFS transporter
MLSLKNKPFYGWVVVAAFLAIGTIMYGTQSSFGVFFKSIGGEFGLSRAATSAIFSVQNVFGSVASIIGGWAVDRYGPRIVVLLIGLFTGLSLLLTSQTNASWQLFITYSLLFCVIGAVYTVMMSTVSRWFDKNRGLALGIAGSGIGLGIVAIAPFATYLISSFDWRMAYIIMGLIAWLIIIPLSRLLKKNPNGIGAERNSTKADSGEVGIAQAESESNIELTVFSLRGASKTRSFWLFGSIWLLTAFVYSLVLIHIVPHGTDIGIPPMQAATVLSLIGASFIAGRLLMGKVSDSIGRKKTAIICSLLAATSLAWLIWSHNLWMLYIFGIFFGLSNGGLDTSIAALIGDTFGMRSIGVIMGTLQFAWGVGMIIGPAIGGFIFDVSNSYFTAFVIVTLTMGLTALLLALTRREIR